MKLPDITEGIQSRTHSRDRLVRLSQEDIRAIRSALTNAMHVALNRGWEDDFEHYSQIRDHLAQHDFKPEV